MQSVSAPPYPGKLIVLSLLLSPLAVVSLWWLFKHHETPTPIVSQAHLKDSFMIHISAANYNDEGKLQALFAASNVDHFSGTQAYRYLQPYVTLYTRQGNQWLITANHGKANAELKTFQLMDHVVVAEDTQTRDPLLVNTSHLTLYPEQRYANTEDNVTLTQGKTQITAKGMKLFWEGETMLYHPVQVTRETFHLAADTLKVKQTPQHTIGQITTEGKRAHFWSTPENVEERIDAWADTIHYFPSQNKITLHNHALVLHRGDRLSGSDITYDLVRQVVQTQGDKRRSMHIILHRNRNTAT